MPKRLLNLLEIGGTNRFKDISQIVGKMSFMIHLLRNVEENKNDDVIRIVPSDRVSGQFDLIYQDGFNKSCRNRKVSYTYDEVFEYVESLFDLVPVDADPFLSIQFTAPMFPGILIARNDLKNDEIRSSILNVLRRTLLKFPSIA